MFVVEKKTERQAFWVRNCPDISMDPPLWTTKDSQTYENAHCFSHSGKTNWNCLNVKLPKSK